MSRIAFHSLAAWPKTLLDFAPEGPLVRTASGRHPTLAAVDPFRPSRTPQSIDPLLKIQEVAPGKRPLKIDATSVSAVTTQTFHRPFINNRRAWRPQGRLPEIGRASCRERVEISVVAVS